MPTDELTITQFALETRFSRRQIHRYISGGQITPRRTPGGRPYFLRSDVDDFKARFHLNHVHQNRGQNV